MRTVKAVVVAVVVASLTYVSYCGILIGSGNFHAVAEGRLYRSAQLDKQGFSEAIAARRIRTILNLRGRNPGQRWYQDEIAAAREQGVRHYDIGLSAQEPVSADKLQAVVALLRDAPEPILVHCKSGADRTGLVSALYRYEILGHPAERAARELSVWYGHFPYLISKTGAMDRSAALYFARHPRTAPDRMVRPDSAAPGATGAAH